MSSQRFENIVSKVSENDLETALKSASEKGWELVNTVRAQDETHIFGSTPWFLFYKRPLAEQPPMLPPPPSPYNQA